ncbi:unnamed protein product [Urochloa humidicola]
MLLFFLGALGEELEATQIDMDGSGSPTPQSMAGLCNLPNHRAWRVATPPPPPPPPPPPTARVDVEMDNAQQLFEEMPPSWSICPSQISSINGNMAQFKCGSVYERVGSMDCNAEFIHSLQELMAMTIYQTRLLQFLAD